MERNTEQGWNGKHGGWVGSQLGATAWLFLAGMLATNEGSMSSGLTVCGLFLIVNGIGLVFWACRRRLRYSTALTLLLLVSGTASTVAIYVLNAAGAWEAIQMEPWVFSAGTSYLFVVAVHLVAAVVFHRVFRRETSAST